MTCTCNQSPCCCGATPQESGNFSWFHPEAEEGYAQAVRLLHRVSTPDGFVAAATDTKNYRRIWSRDGIICGLAALLSGDASLIGVFKQTLITLADHQGPEGEIPSNVDAIGGRVSYGGTTGRVDADLWFIIGCVEYWLATEDGPFLKRMLSVLERVDFLLRAWEFNHRGLLFVPPAGDWADEYIQSGYVLYDQLLYLQAQRSLAHLFDAVGERTQAMDQHRRARQLKQVIQANYWFQGVEETPEAIYHEVLYRKGQQSPRCRCRYWVPFFSPHGYGYRFDAFANVLASLLGVANDDRRARVDQYIADVTRGRPALLPAFDPVIEPVDEDWARLQVTFTYTFRNNPHEYHNGGLWPMVSGFYAADLAMRGKQREAEAFLNGINWANALDSEGEPWSFPEYIHGRKLIPGGTRQQAWSGAASILAQQTLRGMPLLRVPIDTEEE